MSARASYYVYYRVDPASRAELRRGIEVLLSTLRDHCGVRGRWQQRRDDSGTYMEIYDGVADTAEFESLLRSEVERLGLERCLAPGSTRRTDIFVDVTR